MQQHHYLAVYGLLISSILFYGEVLSKQRLSKRFLLFPRQAPTRHQFIGGIGIPADLAYESLTMGYVLKAEFWLPFNASVFRENPFLPEYLTSAAQLEHTKRAAKNPFSKRSNLRWDIYAYVAELLQRRGYKGVECVLRAICEANSLRFDQHFNVFAELLHILLSPSTSLDLETTNKDMYLQAERLGRKLGLKCCATYDCSLSLLNLISTGFVVG